MNPTKTGRVDAIYGLRAIAAFMGRRDPRTIIHWRDRFGFPLFYDPSALLSGKYRFYTTPDAIKCWEYALAAAVARKEGKEFNQNLDCPLCGRSGDVPGKEELAT